MGGWVVGGWASGAGRRRLELRLALAARCAWLPRPTRAMLPAAGPGAGARTPTSAHRDGGVHARVAAALPRLPLAQLPSQLLQPLLRVVPHLPLLAIAPHGLWRGMVGWRRPAAGRGGLRAGHPNRGRPVGAKRGGGGRRGGSWLGDRLSASSTRCRAAALPHVCPCRECATLWCSVTVKNQRRRCRWATATARGMQTRACPAPGLCTLDASMHTRCITTAPPPGPGGQNQAQPTAQPVARGAAAQRSDRLCAITHPLGARKPPPPPAFTRLVRLGGEARSSASHPCTRWPQPRALSPARRQQQHQHQHQRGGRSDERCRCSSTNTSSSRWGGHARAVRRRECQRAPPLLTPRPLCPAAREAASGASSGSVVVRRPRRRAAAAAPGGRGCSRRERQRQEQLADAAAPAAAAARPAPRAATAAGGVAGGGGGHGAAFQDAGWAVQSGGRRERGHPARQAHCPAGAVGLG